MLDYYPLLIECAIDFKIESRKILAAHTGKHKYLNLTMNFSIGAELVINESVETCRVALGYRIVKHENNFYCLKSGQTLEDRM